MIKPKALKQGDTIAIVAPASPTTDENVKKAYDKIVELGFKVKMGKSPYKRYGYLSGSDKLRADDINSMFEDKEVDGIICIRGGYGTPRILDLLDYEVIRSNPKVFVGYSDITALHIAFNQIAELVTYHGPMVASNMIDYFSDFSKENLFRLIMGSGTSGKLINPEGEEIVTINGGLAEGILVGGNLSLIADTIGSPYEIDTRGKILFIEEVEEEPYNIDRMLTQLRLSGKLNDAEAIVLGDFNDCLAKEGETSLSLEQVIEDIIKPVGKPSIYNLQAGHCKPALTLALGLRYRLDADKKELVLLDYPTSE